MVFTKSLKGRYTFKLVFKRGKYTSNKYITLYTLKNTNNDSENCLGICVSKKHGNSVTRNRLKRWAKEAYKEIEKSLKKGYYIIVLYKKNIEVENLDYTVIKQEIEECMKEQEMVIYD